MEKTIVKYVTGLSENASAWEKRNNKKYGTLSNICRQLDYDIKHGVTKDQVLSFLDKVQHNSSFSKVRKNDNSVKRLDEVKEHFTVSKRENYW